MLIGGFHLTSNKLQTIQSLSTSDLNAVSGSYTKTLSSSNTVLANSIEIIPDRLFWYCNRFPPKNVADSFFFNIDDILVYNGYNKDFGPLSLAQVHRFCTELNRIMQDPKYENIKIFHHCSPHYHKQANACFLMGAFMIICYHYTAEEAWCLFQQIQTSLIPFRDAGEEPSSFECSVYDCLRGLEKAFSLGWYNYKKFDYKEYEQMHRLDNGDMNWIIPKKILALSSPTEQRKDGLPASFFVDKFNHLNIRGVIRLNEQLYDENIFRKQGINVYDLEFLDGSCPDDGVIQTFINICDKEINSGGAVAVHCRAGLGRTGTLIGLYIMSKFNFDPKALIGWLRIARPGSVIGIQQDFLCNSVTKMRMLSLKRNDSIVGKGSFNHKRSIHNDENLRQDKSVPHQQSSKRNSSVNETGRSFGKSKHASQYNIGLGKSSQGEQLMEKRKKLTGYITMIDKMINKKDKKSTHIISSME